MSSDTANRLERSENLFARFRDHVRQIDPERYAAIEALTRQMSGAESHRAIAAAFEDRSVPLADFSLPPKVEQLAALWRDAPMEGVGWVIGSPEERAQATREAPKRSEADDLLELAERLRQEAEHLADRYGKLAEASASQDRERDHDRAILDELKAEGASERELALTAELFRIGARMTRAEETAAGIVSRHYSDAEIAGLDASPDFIAFALLEREIDALKRERLSAKGSQFQRDVNQILRRVTARAPRAFFPEDAESPPLRLVDRAKRLLWPVTSGPGTDKQNIGERVRMQLVNAAGSVVDDLITTEQAAKMLGVSLARVSQLVAAGELDRYPLNARFHLLSRKQVERYAESDRTPGRKPASF